MKFRPAFAVLSMTLALAACGDQMPWEKKTVEEAAPVAPTHSGPPAVSPLEQPIETGAAGVARATSEASTASTKFFRAAGQGWVATAGEGSVVYERPGQKSVGIAARRMGYARGVEFIGVMSGRPFSLNIQAAECTDASGAKHPFTARLSSAGGKLAGCASPTDSQPKAQVKASSATGTTKPKAAAPKPAEAAKPAEGATPATSATEGTPAAGATPTPATSTPAANTPATNAPATSTTPATTSVAPATSTTPSSAAGVQEGPADAPATPAVPAVPVPVITTPAAPVITAPATDATTTAPATSN